MPSKHHEIEITRNGNKALPPTPVPELEVGDTVHYFFKGDGHVTITFPKLSPYRKDEEVNKQVTDAETVTVQKTGLFRCGCRLTFATGESVGWDADNPESGGEHRVRR